MLVWYLLLGIVLCAFLLALGALGWVILEAWRGMQDVKKWAGK